jgi:hypothetical protein
MTEDMQNFDAKRNRRDLFELLGHVLATAKEKFDCQRVCNGDRQKWARIIITGVEAYAELLKGVQLEELEERLSKLECEGENVG